MNLSLEKRLHRARTSNLLIDDDRSYNKINRELYDECLAHRNQFAQPLKDNLLVMIHYDFYSIINGLSLNAEWLNYWINSRALMDSCHKTPNWSVVLFNFPEVYFNSKSLIEQGVFSKVFFTYFLEGRPYNEDLSELKNKQLIITGCYADICVKDLINHLLEESNDISIIPEAVLFSNRFKKYKITNQELLEYLMNLEVYPKVKITSLEEFIHYLNP